MPRRAAALAALAALAACGDLFHPTDWGAACQTEACRGVGGGASSGQGGVGAGAGGEDAGGSGPCQPGDTEGCFDGPAAKADVGACRSGERECGPDGTWESCLGQVLPADTETCDVTEDADCDGETSNGCVYGSCSTLPPGSTSGTYKIDPDGDGPGSVLTLYCDVTDDGSGWALLANSVGSDATLAFWQFAYANRLDIRGTPDPATNYYAGSLYQVGVEYRDQVVDLADAVIDVAQVTVTGFDPTSFVFAGAALVSGSEDVFTCQFAGGWASGDFDGDQHPEANCSALYASVAQHYCSCWVLNFGADAELPYEDQSWGPHAAPIIVELFALATDGTSYTRLKRYSRWVRW
ncbi:MAG: fibrinogen-like YCDxxxxGGGW domain-containing protein [Polyangiaceae bacterium]